MNKTMSQKYDLPPETVKKKSIEDEKFREIYDFHRMVRISRDAERYKRHEHRFNKKSRKKLHNPLVVGEKFPPSPKKSEKKMRQVIYIKVRPKTFHFLIESECL